MAEEKKEEKRPVAQEVVLAREVAMRFHSDDPEENVIALAQIYYGETVVPAKDIPEHIKNLKKAKESIVSIVSRIDDTIGCLKKQAEETKKKETEKKKD